MNILGCLGCLFCCAYAVYGQASADNPATHNLILQQDLASTFEIAGVPDNTPNVTINHHVPADPLVDAVTVSDEIDATALNNKDRVYSHKQGLLQARFDEIYLSVIDGSDANENRFESTITNNLTVFNIKGSDRLNGGSSFGFSPSVPVIINVSGTDLLDINARAQGNFDKLSVSPLVFWNFYDYTGLNFSGSGWHGSVLAPYVHLTSYTGSLDGGLATVTSLSDAEVHNKLLTYEPPQRLQTAISEPSAAIMLLGGLWLTMRSRRKLANV